MKIDKLIQELEDAKKQGKTEVKIFNVSTEIEYNEWAFGSRHPHINTRTMFIIDEEESE